MTGLIFILINCEYLYKIVFYIDDITPLDPPSNFYFAEKKPSITLKPHCWLVLSYRAKNDIAIVFLMILLLNLPPLQRAACKSDKKGDNGKIIL